MANYGIPQPRPRSAPLPGRRPTPGDGPPVRNFDNPSPGKPPTFDKPRPRGGQPYQMPTPAFVDNGYGSAAGGPSGVGGTGGYGFTNMAQYMYANPGSAVQTPTGYTADQYNPAIHGFGTNYGSYTQGMAGVDNALNQAYHSATPDEQKGPLYGPSLPSGQNGWSNLMASIGFGR